MYKLIYLLFLFLFFSVTVSAQEIPLSTVFSFAPPVSDNSIIFLGNIFGVVDGVLSGTGSQLFGQMMQVLNAAVLALGSIVIMYTMIVGTLNTAHEGQFLGQKWSKIWIPVRCSVGLGLLIPKASGYCLMQIFVMWIVVQGVGAADKVWHAALQYLNSGGKIVQAQLSSSQILNTSSMQSNPIFIGAEDILTGQVCMYGLQKILENIHSNLLNLANEKQQGPCYQPISGSGWSNFCSGSIPDFLATFDAIKAQKNAKDKGSANPSINMPNFENDGNSLNSLFSALNGICGTISWNYLSNDSMNSSSLQSSFNFSEDEADTYLQSRAIAIQQMYTNLQIVAQGMVNNDPDLNQDLKRSENTADYASYAANSQFGVAKNANDNSVCSSQSSACQSWGSTGTGPGVLFNGNEFLNSLAAYDGLMSPVLTLQQQMSNMQSAQQSRNFLSDADAKGWMFAGAYFFNLVSLSGSTVSSNLQDNNSGLDKSISFKDKKIYPMDSCDLTKNPQQYAEGNLCWFIYQGGQNTTTHQENQLLYLLRGGSIDSNYCTYVLDFAIGVFDPTKGYITATSSSSDAASANFQNLQCSSTTLGFIGNSYYLNLPGQAGATIVQMPAFPDIIAMPPVQFPSAAFPTKCHAPYFLCIDVVFAYVFGGLFMSIIFVFLNFAFLFVGVLVSVLLILPLKMSIWPMVQQAITILGSQDVNPIVNIANMGAMFIQNTFSTYISFLSVAALGAVPFLGSVLTFLMALFAPIYTAWLAYFFGVGFTTAYYVPFIPYMIFTFGVISWIFNVIEAIVAAPIMALGVTTPEGEGILGKGEHGLMILMNIFLRPSMMVIGFVAATAMTYVSIWILNAGFGQGGSFLLGQAANQAVYSSGAASSVNMYNIRWGDFPFAQLLGCMVYIVIYVSIYVTLVQKVFTLIFVLPDKVMRWMGGHPEASEIQQWMQETSQKLEQFGQSTGGGLAKSSGEVVEAAKGLRKDFESATGKGGGEAG